MNGNLSKEYIKNYAIRVVSGKVSTEELTKIRKALLNYSQEDWKKLLVIGKELIIEKIDEFVQSNENNFGEEEKAYKDDVLDLAKAGINFYLAIFNENVFYKAMQLEKQSKLTEEQKLTQGLFIVLSEISKITSQSPKVANYHDIEVSLTKKYQKLRADKFWRKYEMDELDEYNKVQLEFLEIVQSLTPEEIIVLKKKIKVPIISFIEKILVPQVPEEFKKFFSSESIIKTVLDVIDAIADEKLIKEVINLQTKFFKEIINNPQKYKNLSPFKQIKEMGLEEETKGLIRVLTNHLNKLADKVSRYPTISPVESEGILKKLSEDIKKEVGQNTPPPPTDQDFKTIVTSLGNVFSEINNNKSEFLKTIDGSLNNVQSKGKWYKDPVKVSLLAVSIVVVSSLIGWLFFRKKNNQNNYD